MANARLLQIMLQRKNQIDYIGEVFGDMESDMLKRLVFDAKDMSDGFAYHTCRLISSWASDAQEATMIRHGVAPDDMIIQALNLLKRDLFDLADELNGRPKGTRILNGGLYSHENYQIEKEFQAKYTRNY